MKSFYRPVRSLLFVVAVASSLALATPAGWQGGVGRGPVSTPRDPELERQSMHNLEVARWYFYKRRPPKDQKAANERLNKAVEGRLQEILDLNPTFAKADEVYFLLGEVYLRMDDREKAAEHFSRVVKEFPDSQFTADAKKRLGELQSTEKGKKD